MSGYKVLHHIKSLNKGNQVIMLTASNKAWNLKEGDKPVLILANTVKGKGVDFMEGNHKWHGGGIAKEQLDLALESIAKNRRA